MKYSEAWNEMHKNKRMPTYYDPSFCSQDEDIFIGVTECAWCKKEIIAVWDAPRLLRGENRCPFPRYPLPYLGRPSERKRRGPICAYSAVLNAVKKKCNLFDVLVNVLFRVSSPDNKVAAEFFNNPYNVELLCSNCFLKTVWQDQCKKVLKLRNTYYKVVTTSPSQTEEEVLTKLGFRRRKEEKGEKEWEAANLLD